MTEHCHNHPSPNRSRTVSEPLADRSPTKGKVKGKAKGKQSKDTLKGGGKV